MRVARGEPQVYGTQLGPGLQPRPVEDPEHLDERRSAAGLPPFADYLEQARRVTES